MVARCPCICLPTGSLVKAMWPTRATIKAHSTRPLPARPYGSRVLLPVTVASPYLWLMPIGRPRGLPLQERLVIVLFYQLLNEVANLTPDMMLVVQHPGLV